MNKKLPENHVPQKAADFVYDEPFDLRQRFRNLKDPLQFIESDKIRNLQQAYIQQKSKFRKLQDHRADFSKSIYKKVISQDNEFSFQDKVSRKMGEDLVEQYNQRSSRAAENQKILFQKTKRQDLKRPFKHGDSTPLRQKKDKLRESSQIPLTFAHVKLIDTPQFQQLKKVQFYSLLRGEQDEKELLHQGIEIDNLSFENHVDTFKHSLIDTSQYHTKQSTNFLFDCDRELKFWKIQNMFGDQKKSQQEVISTCAFLDPKDISVSQMFDFSARNIEITDLIRFYSLKGQLKAKFEMDRNNENLEEKYYEAKRRFEELKEIRLKSKNQRMPAKFVSNMAQTNDQMSEKDFEDYFVEDASNIFEKLKYLNIIRDRVVEEEEGEVFTVMATNIGYEIGKELFKLLVLVLKGEKVQSYSQLMHSSNEEEVERKILQLIYLQFSNFAVLEVDGTSKVEIVKRYLQQRQKNQRFYETYQLKRKAKTKI